jgi:hypothetical protein
LKKRLSEIEGKLRQPVAAFAIARDAAELCPDEWERWHLAASLAARCLKAIENGAPVAGDRRATVTEEYSKTIVQFLRKAVENGYDGATKFCTEESVPSLAERADFQVLLNEVQDLGGGSEGLKRALEKSPVKFTFNYKFDDPGKRRWVRTGKVWTETQPSGRQNTHFVSVPRIVEGVPGTEITKEDGDLALFVPYRSSGPMKLMMKSGSGNWGFLGVMEDVE